MASTTRIPKLRVTASEAKNGFGRVLDRVAKEGAVVITKHDRPDAVILSIAEYERLAAPKGPDLDALTAQFDAMFERMQEPGAAEKMAKAFAMKPAELGRVALAAGKPKRPAAAKRVRRARG